MNTKNDKLITAGIVAGMMFSNIPFYFQIIHFSSLGILKKCGGLFALALANVIAATVGIVGFIIWIVKISVEIMEYWYQTSYDYVSGYEDSSFEIIETLMLQLLIVTLFLLAISALMITTGLMVKSYIDSDKSNHLTGTEKFQLAKLAGSNLLAIPFYMIVKCIISYATIEQIDTGTSGLLITYFILTGACIILPFIPILNLFSSIASLALFIVAIFIGIKLNDASPQLMNENENPQLNFNSF